MSMFSSNSSVCNTAWRKACDFRQESGAMELYFSREGRWKRESREEVVGREEEAELLKRKLRIGAPNQGKGTS